MKAFNFQEGRGPYTDEKTTISLPCSVLIALIQEVLSTGRQVRFYAPGQSMTPFIRNGDILTIAPVQNGFIRYGDVVAFIDPETGSLYVHRVLTISRNTYRIRGDNTMADDGEVTDNAILGRVVNVERDAQPSCFGLGPERIVIAMLSRAGLLIGLVRVANKISSAIRVLS